MLIDYSVIATHGEAYPSNCLASTGGAHVRDMVAAKDLDNGNIVGKGTYVDFLKWNTANPTTFTAVVLDQAVNGNWYVEVATAANAYLVCTTPDVQNAPYEGIENEELFYNKKDSIVRAIELKPGDIFEVSEKAFSGKPVKGKALTATNNVLTVGA